jgi:hypothetical protein
VAQSEGRKVRVRFFGRLHTFRKARGLPVEVELEIPEGGRTASQIAADLELPPESIEAVFCNHRAFDLSHAILPGDRIAFVPTGTPGPHRYTLGIYEAGVRKRPA